MDTPDIRITVNGHPAHTIEQAATRYGLKHSSMRAAITRAGTALRKAGQLDGRKPLYYVTDLDALIGGRPGRGRSVRAAVVAEDGDSGGA